MISAIILAAGMSKRMGKQKVLLPYRGATVLEHIIGQIAEAGVDEIIIVVGHERDNIEQCLQCRTVKLVVNSCYENGMLSSVRAGMDAMDEKATSVMVLLGDQPHVRAGIVRQLIDQFAVCGKGIIAPSFEGRAGHPALFSVRYRDEVMRDFDDTGLRGLFAAHPADIEWVTVQDAGVVEDMDTPEDYERILKEAE